MANEHGEQIRIVQETVAGKEITFAHVMGGPAPIIYQKLGLNPQLDYRSSAIGIMNVGICILKNVVRCVHQLQKRAHAQQT